MLFFWNGRLFFSIHWCRWFFLNFPFLDESFPVLCHCLEYSSLPFINTYWSIFVNLTFQAASDEIITWEERSSTRKEIKFPETSSHKNSTDLQTGCVVDTSCWNSKFQLSRHVSFDSRNFPHLLKLLKWLLHQKLNILRYQYFH